ncbi:S1/P1 nuclease-domain-containing protein [Dendryphion nanum]|uniref:S1/P1 nuclease-domain-containing protein n=1 Tax=Dendryphion nanum TaxID=256645 RepID=A0A9P9DPD7_9PLEO|nr:S1/P1 nuclease-domain-containing protein [Dendryphion nanum]
MVFHLLALLPLLPSVSAWGTLGHNTVALIAQNLISNKTASFAQSLLNDTSSNYLLNVATWADSYRSEPDGRFSSVYHYIDAFDSPPSSCEVDYDRDCPEEGCIVSAIANYTTRVAARNISHVERQKALKWIIHFVGDIHQPLHVENLAVGGNLINVTFNGTNTNLHAIWDSNIPNKLVGGSKISDAHAWADELTTAVEIGKFAKQSKKWLRGINIHDSISTAMIWANDANDFICSTVVPKGEAAVKFQELSGGYYESAVPVVEMQIAKAGVRLAAWLDLIVTGKVGKGGYGGKKGGKKGYTKRSTERREVKLEEWMLEARRAREAVGGCSGHEH